MKPHFAMFSCFLVVGCGYLLITASAHDVGNPLYDKHLEFEEEDGEWYQGQEQEGHHEQRFEEQNNEQHEQPEEIIDEQYPQVYNEQSFDDQQYYEVQGQAHEEQQPDTFEHVIQVEEHVEEPHQPQHIEQQEQHFDEQRQQQVEHHQEQGAAKVRQIWDQQYMLNHDHIRRHMAEEHLVVPSLEGLSVAEMQYHLFAAHDYDKNDHLDGLEMIHSIFHDEESKPAGARHLYGDQDLAALVEFLLGHFDADRDGRLSYPEFVRSLLWQRM